MLYNIFTESSFSFGADRALFCAVRVEGGTIAWENGADIDPDVLYYHLTLAWREQEAVNK